MATVFLGAGSGALHAVTGPDHLLSLGPLALGEPRASWRIGLRWGLGHALGTLALAVPLLILASIVQLSLIASWGDRLAGVALILTAMWSWFSTRHSPHAPAQRSRGALWVGLVHGLSGAGSLLLVLPVLLSGPLTRGLMFLAAFALGSTLAMAALTWAIAKLGGKLQAAVLIRLQPVFVLASLALGTVWLLRA